MGGTTALTFVDYFARAKEVTVMPKQGGDQPGQAGGEPQAPPAPASRHEHRAPPRDGNGRAG